MQEGTHMYVQTGTTVAPHAGASRGVDPAMWGLIALVGVLVAGGLGWGIARSQQPSWSDTTQASALARQEGQLRGQERGYSEGAAVGRKEARLQAQLSAARSERTSYMDGYRAGVTQGRATARAQRGSGLDVMGLPASSSLNDSIDELIASTDLALGTTDGQLSRPAGYGAGYGAGTGVPGYDASSSALYDELPAWRR